MRYDSNIYLFATGSTISPIYYKDYKNDYPSLPEQQQIADFLSAIDNKITLCNQQITQVEQYKK